jgi:transcriptional regulator with PAS, ATPase and Fis domain
MKDTLGSTTLPQSEPQSLRPIDERSFVLGETPAIRRISKHAERASEVECTVLISGETGTGKEVWAKQVHAMGPRSKKPFVPVNCAALTSTLAESQLFGHEKGAFTGAFGASLGVFRAAEGGVVFLDEVGEMPLELQPKLLRVLQEQEVTPVGASQPIKIDVQVVAATNRKLEDEVSEGRFREDLYFRLNMVELQIPSLRERSPDIRSFIDYFAALFAEKYNRAPWAPTTEELIEFEQYSWPGNIRQLSHVIEQAYVLDCAPMLPHRTSQVGSERTLPSLNLNELRKLAVDQALKSTNGHKGKAAGLLGVHANTLTRMLAEIAKEEASA